MSVLRCKHLDGELTELTEYTQVFRVGKGVPVEWTYVEYDQVTGYTYKCFGCNGFWRFRIATQIPKWLERIVDLAVGRAQKEVAS